MLEGEVGERTSVFTMSPMYMGGRTLSRASSECPISSKASVASLPAEIIRRDLRSTSQRDYRLTSFREEKLITTRMLSSVESPDRSTSIYAIPTSSMNAVAS